MCQNNAESCWCGLILLRAGDAAQDRKVWTAGQLQTFLQRSRSDRFFALWVLEATSGMRHCELVGARRDLLDQERTDFGPDYRDHGVLFCWGNGNPCTLTRSPDDSRSPPRRPPYQRPTSTTYGTATRPLERQNRLKALSKRIGHADVAFTMKQYVQTGLEADREVANTLADLIIGGLLATNEKSA